MKPVLFAILLFFIAVPAYAVSQQPTTRHACQACQDCACDAGQCPCPQVVTMPDGRRVVLLNQRPAWPAPGSLPYAVGVVGRWGLGAPQRYPLRYQVVR